MISSSKRLDQLCINTIRGLAMDAVQAANSGHPGMPMGAAAMAYALWFKHLRHNPRNPKWPNRDRFILSAGHGSMLLYSLLHLTGYDLPLEELKNFRQWGSKTPGHPENILTPGVEMATGPLGQGFATAVGMAIAERHLSATLGEGIIDHYTYGICSDGDLMEGISSEAASLAGHLKLGKLIFLYDDNSITIDGSTDLAFTEDVTWKFEAIGWHVLSVDGMDPDAVDEAITEAKEVTDAPSLIRCRTTIGFGSPNRAGTAKSHGEALGEDEVKLAKQKLGIPLEPLFHIHPDALAEFRKALDRGAELEANWASAISAEALHDLEASFSGALGSEWLGALEPINEKVATRAASGKTIQSLSKALPGLLGGSADLSGSVNTTQKNVGFFTADSPKGRNISFGVREHAMMAAVNGITLHGGCRAFAGTFLVFSDYCKPSLRLAALMEIPSVFIFTHDSIGLGEDGPTHQPIEHLAGLRAIPNFNVMRPADGNETVACWKVALSSTRTPTALILTRQGLSPVSPEFSGEHPAEKGAYVLREASSDPVCILIGTGSEVQVALAAADMLEAGGTPTRVVSMPSWFLFEDQDESYRQSVLPQDVPTVSVEAATTMGWCRYAQGHVGIDRFGASAPGPVALEKFGFTAENVARIARELLGGARRPISNGDQALSHVP